MKRILLTILFTCSCAGFSAAQADKYPLQIGDTDTISELNWSPDDRLILTSSGDDNALRLWDVATGRVLWKSDVSFLQDGTEIYTVRVSDWTRDLKFIVTGTSNGKLQLWEAETGRLVWNVKAHAETVTALAASPDGKMVVSSADAGDGKSELKAWDLAGGRLLKDLSPGQKDIRAIRFVDAGRFQTGNGFGLVTTWSSDGCKAISTRRVFPCGAADQRRNSSAYSRDLSLIASQCRKSLVVTNVWTGRVVKRIPKEEHYSLPSFSRDGKVLLLPDTIDARVIDLRANSVKEFDEFDGGALKSDGSLVAALPNYRADGVRLFDTRTGRRRGWLVGHPGVIKALAFSPDGRRFASGSADRVVRVWETRGRKILLQLEGHSDKAQSVNFGKDGKTLTSQSEKETIVWDAEKGVKLREVKEERRFEGGGSRYLSPSGRLALVEEHERPFRLVNAITDETIKEFFYIGQLDNLVFCSDEKHFLAKPWWGGWQLWSVEGGGPLREFDVGYSFYNRVAFHPDGRTFITGGEGQNILMFDLESGGAWEPAGPIAGAMVVASSGDSRQEIATGADGRYRFSGLPPGKYAVRVTLPAKLSPFEDQTVEVHDRGCAEVSISAVTDGRIAGRLLDAEGRPLEGRSVDLLPFGRDGKLLRRLWAYTKEEGSFQYSQLPPGRYVLAINTFNPPDEKLPYRKTFFPSTNDQSAAEVMTLDEGQHLSGLDFRLPPPLVSRELTGMVLWPDGRPAVGAEVRFEEVESGRLAKFGLKTDAAGLFKLQGYEGLLYRVEASIPADPDWNPDSGRSVELLVAPKVEVTPSAQTAPLRLVINTSGDGVRRTRAVVGPGRKPSPAGRRRKMP